EGKTMADVARANTETYLQVIDGARFAEPSPRPMFPNPHPGPLAIQPQSPGLRERIWWGSASNATGVWAAGLGMNLMSSTLKEDESGKPFHVQQAEQIEAYRQAWREAGHSREPRVSVSRSIFPLVSAQDRSYFGHGQETGDSFGHIDDFRGVFGRSYAAEPDQLIEQLAEDTAVAAADTLLLTIPNQLGVAYNLTLLENFAKYVAPALGWVPNTQK
ncbi:MAG: LLM class flavin-dependent oxidoreductase, partial [Propioniciclava sp.]